MPLACANPYSLVLAKKMAGHCLQYPANASFWGETIKNVKDKRTAARPAILLPNT